MPRAYWTGNTETLPPFHTPGGGAQERGQQLGSGGQAMVIGPSSRTGSTSGLSVIHAQIQTGLVVGG